MIHPKYFFDSELAEAFEYYEPCWILNPERLDFWGFKKAVMSGKLLILSRVGRPTRGLYDHTGKLAKDLPLGLCDIDKQAIKMYPMPTYSQDPQPANRRTSDRPPEPKPRPQPQPGPQPTPKEPNEQKTTTKNEEAKPSSDTTLPEKPVGPHPEHTPRVGDHVYKTQHEDGFKHPTAPEKDDRYTLQRDEKPLGATQGEMPDNCRGLQELPESVPHFDDPNKGKPYDELMDEGYPDLTGPLPEGGQLADHKTFSSLTYDTLRSGESIYRIIDEKANPSACFWTAELPKNKTAWRKDNAVKDSWNDNGYYCKYTIKEGEDIKVWRGKTAGQKYEDWDGKQFYLEGQEEQIYVKFGQITPDEIRETNWEDARL